VIITERFVYIHMPKTGGTFVEAALERLLSSQKTLYIDTATDSGRLKLRAKDQHQTVSQIPSVFRDRPIVFTVRNPYDHYVSFYEFAWWKDHPGDTFDERRIRRRYPHYPEITYREFLEAGFDWEMLDERYIESRLARRLHDAGVGPLTFDYIRFLFDQPDQVLENLDCYLSEDHCRRASNIHFIRMERLNRELYDFLLSVGYESEQTRFVLEMDKIYPSWGNKKRTDDWTSYYTPDMKRLIREQENRLFGMFPDYDA